MVRALAIVLLFAATAHADDRIDSAKQAIDKMHYKEAGESLEHAIASGELDAKQLAEAYLLSGFVAVVVDAPDAEDRFRRALELDPELTLPAGSAPKLTGVFDKARAFVTRNGALAVRVVETRDHTIVTVERDSMRLARTVGGVTNDKSIRGTFADNRVELAATALASIIVRDEHGNELVDISADHFEHQTDVAPIVVAAAPSPFYRSPLPWWIGAGVGVAVGAVAAYEASSSEDRVSQLIANSSMYNFDEVETERKQWHRDAVIADISFGIGGGFAVVGVVMAVTRTSGESPVRARVDRDGASASFVVHW